MVLDSFCLFNKVDKIYMDIYEMLVDEIRNKYLEYLVSGGKGR